MQVRLPVDEASRRATLEGLSRRVRARGRDAERRAGGERGEDRRDSCVELVGVAVTREVVSEIGVADPRAGEAVAARSAARSTASAVSMITLTAGGELQSDPNRLAGDGCRGRDPSGG